jgi:predicted nucleic acid-binding protein
MCLPLPKGEIQAGVEMTRERDQAKASEIERWLDDLSDAYNVVPADAAVCRRCAQLMHHQDDNHIEDALIAATALVHDFTVSARNVDDFRAFGVKLFNPFTAKSRAAGVVRGLNRCLASRVPWWRARESVHEGCRNKCGAYAGQRAPPQLTPQA